MIMYLNSEWKENDGGELCIHYEGSLIKMNSMLASASGLFLSRNVEYGQESTRPVVFFRICMAGYITNIASDPFDIESLAILRSTFQVQKFFIFKLIALYASARDSLRISDHFTLIT